MEGKNMSTTTASAPHAPMADTAKLSAIRAAFAARFGKLIKPAFPDGEWISFKDVLLNGSLSDKAALIKAAAQVALTTFSKKAGPVFNNGKVTLLLTAALSSKSNMEWTIDKFTTAVRFLGRCVMATFRMPINLLDKAVEEIIAFIVEFHIARTGEDVTPNSLILKCDRTAVRIFRFWNRNLDVVEAGFTKVFDRIESGLKSPSTIWIATQTMLVASILHFLKDFPLINKFGAPLVSAAARSPFGGATVKTLSSNGWEFWAAAIGIILATALVNMIFSRSNKSVDDTITEIVVTDENMSSPAATTETSVNNGDTLVETVQVTDVLSEEEAKVKADAIMRDVKAVHGSNRNKPRAKRRK
jgi:hypothetical protein